MKTKLAVLAALALAAMPLSGPAQPYAGKTLTIIVGYTAGGGEEAKMELEFVHGDEGAQGDPGSARPAEAARDRARLLGRAPSRTLSVTFTAVLWGIFYALFDRLQLPFPAGWLVSWLGLAERPFF
jgi:hypothetical protein